LIAIARLATAWVLSRSKGDGGNSPVEYALLLTLVMLVCVLAVKYFATSTSTKFSKVASSTG
jgi:Flp pilus assembly pilin Flp